MDKSSVRILRVAHVLLSLDCGGLERVVLDLIRGGQKHQQRVAVICLERPGELAKQAQALGATVHCVDKRSGIDMRLGGRLRTLFERLCPDVVHTHQIGALFYAGAAAHQMSIPSIVHTEHGVHLRGRLRTRLLAALAARHAGRFCCVSEEIANDVRRFRITSQERIRVVRNGVDTNRFARVDRGAALRRALGFSEEAVVIGTVGRLNEIKRQDVLIRGFWRLLQRMPHARLLLVGDGPCRPALMQLTEQLGLGEHVRFAGYQAQSEHYLQAMDLFALTSRSEGMPLAVLEAWSAELPVIASRVGGLCELVEDGQTGLLFSSGDDSELAAQLERLLRDPDLAARLGAAGRRSVLAHYDIMNMVDVYHRHYLQLLDGNPKINDANPFDNQPLSQSLSTAASDV